MSLSSTDLLATLIAFDTTSHRSNLPLLNWVANYLSDLGIQPQLIPSPDGNKANLFATVGPPDAGGVCLHGHTDVVPVDGQPWTRDPYQLTCHEGSLFGRGTSDMKAWIACSLAAFSSYQSQRLRTPIHLALSYDEELGCLGVPKLLAAFGKSLPKPLIAFVGEPSRMAPITAHKGVIALDTLITGRDAHASLLQHGVSAVTAAADMAIALHRTAQAWMHLPGPFGMVPPGPTISVGQLHGGMARNVIAREARLSWELRFRAEDDPDGLVQDALDRVQQRLHRSLGGSADALTVETREVARVPAFAAAPDGLAERLARHCGASGPAQAVPYGAEAGQYAAAGIATVICGPGSIEQAHQPNEFIERSQVDACDRFLARLGEWASQVRLTSHDGIEWQPNRVTRGCGNDS